LYLPQYLGQTRVGNNFAIGTLATFHVQLRWARFSRGSSRGRFLVIAEAMDEARLRVTFDAFHGLPR
jgi:hypothetical protein